MQLYFLKKVCRKHNHFYNCLNITYFKRSDKKNKRIGISYLTNTRMNEQTNKGMITRSCWYPSKQVCSKTVMGRQPATLNIRLTHPSKPKSKSPMCHLAMYNTVLRDPHAILHLVTSHTQHKLSCHIHILSTYPYCIFKHMFQVSGAQDKRHVRKLSVWQMLNNKVTSELLDGRTQTIQTEHRSCQHSE
jgi:hypothetical protein